VSLLLRIDADAGLLPGVIEAPCFAFTSKLGHSGLNERHTGRSGLAQLMGEHGRMSQWPVALRRNASNGSGPSSALAVRRYACMFAMQRFARAWTEFPGFPRG